MRVEIIFI